VQPGSYGRCPRGRCKRAGIWFTNWGGAIISGGWDEGNFTYGPTVAFGDFQLLAQDLGANSSALTAREMASLNSFAAQFGDALAPFADVPGFQVVSVPEPGSAAIVLLGSAVVARRRRRNDHL